MAAAAPPLMDARAFARTLRRMADEIVELNEGTDGLVLIGIQRRGRIVLYEMHLKRRPEWS